MFGDNVRIEKSRIRSEIRKKLSELDESERRHRSGILKDKLFRLDEFRESKLVMFYVSIKGEVETRPMIDEALRMGKRVCLPVIESEKQDMIASEIKDLKEDTRESNFGIREPDKDCPRIKDSRDIDCVIVPGLAFDESLNRLGRGKGYYDRFLRGLPASTPKIALAFQFQKVSNLPTTPADIPVTRLLTA